MLKIIKVSLILKKFIIRPQKICTIIHVYIFRLDFVISVMDKKTPKNG